MGGELDKYKKFSIRDIIYIVVLVLAFAGNYYALSTRLTLVEKASNDNSIILEKVNMELLNYKLGLIMEKLDIPNPGN